jgi:hypothetical protein
MANTNAPFGFKWLGYNRGGPVANFSLRTVKIAYNYSTAALYRGDVLTDLGSGYVGRYTSGDVGSNVAGIAWGFKYHSTALKRTVWSQYLPTTDHAADIEASIIPILGVPPQLFMVQATLTPFVAGDIGSLIEPDYTTNAGNATFGRSGMTIAKGTNQDVTNTLPFRIMDFYSSVAAPGTNGIDDTGNYNIMLVASNPFEAAGV